MMSAARGDDGGACAARPPAAPERSSSFTDGIEAASSQHVSRAPAGESAADFLVSCKAVSGTAAVASEASPSRDSAMEMKTVRAASKETEKKENVAEEAGLGEEKIAKNAENAMGMKSEQVKMVAVDAMSVLGGAPEFSKVTVPTNPPLMRVTGSPSTEALAEAETTATACTSSEEGDESLAPCVSLAKAPFAPAVAFTPYQPTAVQDDYTGGTSAVGYYDFGADADESDVSDDAAYGLARHPNPTRIANSLTQYEGFWSPQDCDEVESWIDETCRRGRDGGFHGEHTLDVTPRRSKFFFGCGYTYGRGMRGHEELLPLGAVDPIPSWMWRLLVRPMEERGVVPYGWIDSVVMNEYRSGSSIVAHVDPPKLFARPIITASFFYPARLVFGASFDPQRRTPPVYAQHLPRGSVLVIDGYAANRVTHGIRPEDLLGPRRVSLILRHVIREHEGQVPYGLSPPHTEHSEVSLALIQSLQGLWRDAPGEGSNVYFVQNNVVTIYPPVDAHVAPAQRMVLTGTGQYAALGPTAADVAAAAAAAAAKTYALLPAPGSISCGDATLDRYNSFPGMLRWRCQTAPYYTASGMQMLQPPPCIGLSWVRMQS
eukprot:TRINITY_DN68299_c0_g1_i1.p1 TRINITY_DN68299_c0_g1~~TRINITY_DN68299_c0_g1_i1.p1  ORF type:complete len:632 (-),score=85.75 TRINITY_DN68299_c0_g1_i1:144-1949(-)